MMVLNIVRWRNLALFGLLSLGTGFAWVAGCQRPKPRTELSIPASGGMAATRSARGGKAALVRLERDMEFSRQHENLTRLLAANYLDGSIRSEIEKELWRLTRVEAAEHEAESALVAQGWTEASVTVLGGQATVIVHGRTLTALEAAGIGRLVAEATGVSESNTRIIERP